MRRVRSSLGSPGYPIVIAAGVNLFLLFCFMVWAPVHRLPRFGVNVYAPESHFVMDSYNRNNLHIITITPGETPRVYAEGVLLSNGIESLATKLDEWAATTTGRKEDVTILLECDPAVSAGMQQKLIDMVLLRKFTCSLVGRPAIN